MVLLGSLNLELNLIVSDEWPQHLEQAGAEALEKDSESLLEGCLLYV